MRPLKPLKPVAVVITLLLLFSFSFRSGHIDQHQLKTSFKQVNDSTGIDTITTDVTKNLSIDDVKSMDLDTSREFAYAEMKNGKKYIVIIPEIIRKQYDSIYNSDTRGRFKIQRSNIDTVKVDGRTFTGIGFESEFPGGINQWSHFMNLTLVYPQEAYENDIYGQVIVRFSIDKDGKVADIDALSGPAELKKAATKMVTKSPKWTPATLNGFNVKSYKSQPVNFRLENNGIPENLPKSQTIDYTGLDTLSMEEMKKLTMDDVDSMTVNPERTRAFVKLKTGKRYVVIISEELRKTADAKYRSNKTQPSQYNNTDSLTPQNDNYGKTFTKVEIEPEYPGGKSVWNYYLQKNLKNQGVDGRVIVRFIVDKEGVVSNIEALEGPRDLWAQAIRLISKSGKWTPAVQNGHQVKSYKILAIDFKTDYPRQIDDQ
jgi:TonB family protein